MWEWLRRRDRGDMTDGGKERLDEAEEAVRRAKLARRAAEEDEAEMRHIADLMRRERTKNHFGPDIYRTMRGRK